jgi:hypothetical protein
VAQHQVAAGVADVIQGAPPRWLESLLLWCLPACDRETISGDLLEEYREVKLPRLGPARANLWYMHQAISFLSVRSFRGPPATAALAWISTYMIIAGVWLGLMEHFLRHPGYTVRIGIAAYIVIHGLATLFVLMSAGRSILRRFVLAGALVTGVLGVTAVIRTLHSPHFEGFVLLIALALISQSVLAYRRLFWARYAAYR